MLDRRPKSGLSSTSGEKQQNGGGRRESSTTKGGRRVNAKGTADHTTAKWIFLKKETVVREEKGPRNPMGKGMANVPSWKKSAFAKKKRKKPARRRERGGQSRAPEEARVGREKNCARISWPKLRKKCSNGFFPKEKNAPLRMCRGLGGGGVWGGGFAVVRVNPAVTSARVHRKKSARKPIQTCCSTAGNGTEKTGGGAREPGKNQPRKKRRTSPGQPRWPEAPSLKERVLLLWFKKP